jgi:hypothetical protein
MALLADRGVLHRRRGAYPEQSRESQADRQRNVLGAARSQLRLWHLRAVEAGPGLDPRHRRARDGDAGRLRPDREIAGEDDHTRGAGRVGPALRQQAVHPRPARARRDGAGGHRRAADHDRRHSPARGRERHPDRSGRQRDHRGRGRRADPAATQPRHAAARERPPARGDRLGSPAPPDALDAGHPLHPGRRRQGRRHDRRLGPPRGVAVRRGGRLRGRHGGLHHHHGQRPSRRSRS